MSRRSGGSHRRKAKVKVTYADGSTEILKPSSFKRRRRRSGSSKRERYDKYLRGPEWKERRREVLERDDHRCVRCGSPAELQVHHRTYERFMHEHLGDLETLCKPCHEKHHAIQGK